MTDLAIRKLPLRVTLREKSKPKTATTQNHRIISWYDQTKMEPDWNVGEGIIMKLVAGVAYGSLFENF